MNNYQHIAQKLLQLLGPNMAIRITVAGYMPLSIEDIGHSPDGFRQISLCHYGEHHLHALWTQDPASGQRILHHIGKTNWQNPIPINPQILQGLITEIEETTNASISASPSFRMRRGRRKKSIQENF